MLGEDMNMRYMEHVGAHLAALKATRWELRVIQSASRRVDTDPLHVLADRVAVAASGSEWGGDHVHAPSAC